MSKRAPDVGSGDPEAERRRLEIVNDVSRKINYVFVYTNQALKRELFPNEGERTTVLNHISPKHVTDLHTTVPMVAQRVSVQFSLRPSELADGTRLVQRLEFQPEPTSPIEVISGNPHSDELATERVAIHAMRHYGGHNSYPCTLMLGCNIFDLVYNYLMEFRQTNGRTSVNLSLADDVSRMVFSLVGNQPPHTREENSPFSASGYLKPECARDGWLADNPKFLYNGVYRFRMLDPHGGGGMCDYCVCSSAHVIARLAVNNWQQYFIRKQRSPGSKLEGSDGLEFVVMKCELFERLVGDFVAAHANHLPWVDSGRVLCELQRYVHPGYWNDSAGYASPPDFTATVTVEYQLELIYSLFPRTTTAVPLVSRALVHAIKPNDKELGQVLFLEARKFLSAKELGSAKFF